MDDEAKSAEQTETAPSQGWQIVRFDALKYPPVWLAASLYVLAALLALAVLVLLAIGLYATFEIAYETVVGELKDRVEAAKVFFPILLALVGGPLLIWRVVTANVQATAARHQADVAQEGLYTSLFTKAVEQLGATREVKETIEIDDAHGVMNRETITKTEPNLEVRLGAIYALERIARDSIRDHWPIMEVLCAYVRNPQNSGNPTPQVSGGEPGTKTFQDWLDGLKSPRVDIQAVVTVIGRRSKKQIQYERENGTWLDISKANLQCVDFNRGNFSRMRMSQANIERGNFYKSNLENTVFMDSHLEGATFSNAYLRSVFFWGAMCQCADFEGARIDLNCAFVMAKFDFTKLYEVDFSKVVTYSMPKLEKSFGDASTILPKDTTRPPQWSDKVLEGYERWREYNKQTGT